MKNILFFLAASLLFFACNNSKQPGNTSDKKADSLYNEVNDLHGSAMGRSMQMEDVQKKVQSVIDSLARLQGNLEQASANYKLKLDSLLSRMKYAGFAMEKWMEEYKPDSLENDVEKRIEYLTSEKIKISRVKEIIVNNLKAADSLLRR